MTDQVEEKKTALVTGASRGIGLAIAKELGSLGFRVICVARSVESASNAVDAVRADGGEAEAYGVDVADSKAVAAASEAILEKYGCVDVLVNNAGITRDMLFIRMSEEDWDAVLTTNLNSCFYWSKNLIRPMTRRRWGRVINISSVIGLTGNAGQANYAAAKAGMIGFTKSLAKELAARSITVNSVAPGFIETDMTRELGEDIQGNILKMIPLKRMGKPEEIAATVGFLAGPNAGYITGQVFTVDGGMVM
ncbi:MAG: 3-oxoacyl-ACP reductase FabG [Puniceicoccales bacterium]